VGNEVFDGVLQIVLVAQTFILGPRFILSVRDYYTKPAASSDESISMTSIAFQERIPISTGSGASRGE
jgi:hypothetical protein